MAPGSLFRDNPVVFGTPKLEGYFYDSTHTSNESNNNANGSTACIVMHPHPKLGGDCNNNVVMGVSSALIREGYSTLRFNFRGVGASRGSSSWKGVSEREDVKNAIEFVKTFDGIEKVVIVGYSFGSAVSLAISSDPKYDDMVDAYVLIGYPRGFWASFMFASHYNLANTSKPKYFILGTQDNFTGVDKLRKFVDGLPGPTGLAVVEGADHFFFSREMEVAQLLISWMKKQGH
mmetsp:Transcript_8151/g.10318  ORF Transcript_8151/g.10318 Transcript_8151/m.10318 type:complete len:233 (+) Transcript_8151:91-789(+)